MPPGGGDRRVWAALPGLGKRGDTRVVFRLIVFARNERTSPGKEELRAFIKAANTVTASYRRE